MSTDDENIKTVDEQQTEIMITTNNNNNNNTDTDTAIEPEIIDGNEGEGTGGNGTSKRKRKRKRKGKASTTVDTNDNDNEDNDNEDNNNNNEANKKSKTTSVEIYDENDCKIYMEGLPFESNEDDITAFFKKHDLHDICDVKMPKWHDSGRSKGYAHVIFQTRQSADTAVNNLNGKDMKGRYVTLKKPLMSKTQSAITGHVTLGEKPQGCKTLFIKNVPYDANEKDVKLAFQECGKIANVRLGVWNHTGKLKGFGYIDFLKEDGCEIASKKQGKIKVNGRVILMDFEMGKPKASFKMTDGRGYKKTIPKQEKRVYKH